MNFSSVWFDRDPILVSWEEPLFGECLPILCFIFSFFNFLNFYLMFDRSVLEQSTYKYMIFLSLFRATALIVQSFYLICLILLNFFPIVNQISSIVVKPLLNLSNNLSLLILTACVIDRYLIIYRKQQPDGQLPLINSIILIAVTAISHIPRWLLLNLENIGVCTSFQLKSNVWILVYEIAIFCFFNFGSLVLLSIFSGLLIKSRSERKTNQTIVELMRPTRQARNSLLVHHSSKSKRQEEERNLTISLLVTSGITIICEFYASMFQPITGFLLWQRFNLLSDETIAQLQLLAFVTKFIQYSPLFFVLFIFNIPVRRVFFSKFV